MQFSIALLLATVATVYSAVVTLGLRKGGSLRAQFLKEDKFADFLHQQRLDRVAHVAVVSSPFKDYYDDFYIVDIALGTPRQNFSVLLDTGSANLWVIDASCVSPACKGYPDAQFVKHQYKNSASSTYLWVPEPSPFSCSGKCYGYVATDVLEIAPGLSYSKQGFGVAQSIADYLGHQPLDGVLGLGWPSLAEEGVAPPLQNLQQQLNQASTRIFFF